MGRFPSVRGARTQKEDPNELTVAVPNEPCADV